MIKLLINILFFSILIGCDTPKKIDIQDALNTTKNIVEKKIIKKTPKKKIIQKTNNKTIFYLVGEPFFIQGVKYIPEENYSYNQVGLATFYGKELHKVKTANNDLNNVTELLGRHKTLPIPSIVKVTNLENGLSLLIKINDRHNDNASLIQVSRKVAQLLNFYKNKIARVNVQILSDPSKQLKTVMNSMNEPEFNTTIESSPTESVVISDLEENNDNKDDITSNTNFEQAIELGFEDVINQELYLKIYGFKSYAEAKNIIQLLEISFKNTTQNEGDNYSIIFGPLENDVVNNLVLSFISKGYKKSEIFLN